MTNKFLKASVGDGRCEPFVNEMSLQNLRGMTQDLFWKSIKNAVDAEKYQL